MATMVRFPLGVWWTRTPSIESSATGTSSIPVETLCRFDRTLRKKINQKIYDRSRPISSPYLRARYIWTNVDAVPWQNMAILEKRTHKNGPSFILFLPFSSHFNENFKVIYALNSTLTLTLNLIPTLNWTQWRKLNERPSIFWVSILRVDPKYSCLTWVLCFLCDRGRGRGRLRWWWGALRLPRRLLPATSRLEIEAPKMRRQKPAPTARRRESS